MRPAVALTSIVGAGWVLVSNLVTSQMNHDFPFTSELMAAIKIFFVGVAYNILIL